MFIDRFIICEVFLARLRLARGDVAGAAAMLAEANQSVRQHNFVHRIPEIAAAQVQVLLCQNNPKAAALFAETHKFPMSRAKVHMFQGNAAEALALLEPLHEQSVQKGWHDELLKVMVLQAVSYHMYGEKDKAFELIGKALSMAEPGGFVRLFVDEGIPMARLLTEAAEHTMMPGYIARLLAALNAEFQISIEKLGLPDSSPVQPMIESLSQRELEILRLVARGFSNHEICRHLFLALDTVKEHNRRIFEKLHVQRRTETVACARELGLIWVQLKFPVLFPFKHTKQHLSSIQNNTSQPIRTTPPAALKCLCGTGLPVYYLFIGICPSRLRKTVYEKEIKMDTSRKNTLSAGILFVIADIAGFLTFLFLGAANGPDYLTQVAGNRNQVVTGALLVLIMALSCSGIAIWLYPVLKKQNEAIALWAVGFRIIEALLGIVSVIGLLALIPLSQEFIKAGTPDASYFQTLGTLIQTTRGWTRDVLMLFAWGLGALLYNYLFYQAKLLPRWLSGWGIVAILLHLASCLITIFDVIGPSSSIQIIMIATSALQELVLAVWLIVKGFNPSAIASLSAKTATNEQYRSA